VRASATSIPGCAVLELDRRADERGDFVKCYQRSVYEQLDLEPAIGELFVSTSRRGVVRGLHFQLPPSDHAKTVMCLTGAVFDVVVDLRADSPTFGAHETFELSGTGSSAVHVPTGCAHGFQALRDHSLMAYLTSTEHDPGRDTGIAWDSVGIRWPIDDPVVSARDRDLPALAAFTSPFRVRGTGG
jgi:dTDP-4-dehydrorhamnose 3,5-epimerase